MFSYEAFGLPTSGFDPTKTFLRSDLVSPYTLAAIRLTIAIYCFTTIIFGYAWQAFHIVATTLRDVNIPVYTLLTTSKAIGFSFSYFTWLTYWSIAFYSLVSGVHTFYYARYHRSWLHDRFPRPLQLLHSLYYTTIVCFPFLVTIVFWGTMYGREWPTDRYAQWINLSVHGSNSLFAVVEIVLPATTPLPFPHLSVLLLILSLYLGLGYLTRYTEGFYVYEWMDPAFGTVSILLHILAYTAGIVAIFAAVRGGIWLRCRLSGERRQVQKRDLEIISEQGSEVELAKKEDA